MTTTDERADRRARGVPRDAARRRLARPRAGPAPPGLTTAEPDDRSARLAAVRAGDVGSVHSWELVTAVDGPGTRLTVFLSGCPLRCLYCHNPDTMEMRRGTDVTGRRAARADRALPRRVRRRPAAA